MLCSLKKRSRRLRRDLALVLPTKALKLAWRWDDTETEKRKRKSKKMMIYSEEFHLSIYDIPRCFGSKVKKDRWRKRGRWAVEKIIFIGQIDGFILVEWVHPWMLMWCEKLPHMQGGRRKVNGKKKQRRVRQSKWKLKEDRWARLELYEHYRLLAVINQLWRPDCFLKLTFLPLRMIRMANEVGDSSIDSCRVVYRVQESRREWNLRRTKERRLMSWAYRRERGRHVSHREAIWTSCRFVPSKEDPARDS